MEVVHTLYTEDVISKETFDDVKRSGGLLTGDTLKTLSDTVSKHPSQLETFGAVLLQSEETVGIGKNTLKDFGRYINNSNYVTIIIYY